MKEAAVDKRRGLGAMTRRPISGGREVSNEVTVSRAASLCVWWALTSSVGRRRAYSRRTYDDNLVLTTSFRRRSRRAGLV